MPDTPYEIVKDLENHYQNVLWILFKLMGYYTQAEYQQVHVLEVSTPDMR